MKIKLLFFLHLLSYALVLWINFLSGTGAINAETQASVSNAYYNLIVPAGYAFSIWGLIYLSIFGYLWFLFQRAFLSKRRPDTARVQRTAYLFFLTHIFNISWIFAWNYHLIGLACLILFFFFMVLLLIFLNEDIALTRPPLSYLLTVHWPFTMYFAWMGIALTANTAAWLTSLGFRQELDERLITHVIIVVVTLIYLVVVKFRYSGTFGLVGAWALSAIAVARYREEETGLVWAAGIASACLLVFSIYTLMKRFKGRA